MTADATWEKGSLAACLAIAAAVAAVVSIRAFEILMAATLVALLVTRAKWYAPPIWRPLALFLGGTLVSLFASGHVHDGLPQVRKMYVYLMLFLVTSALRGLTDVLRLAIGWSVAAAASSLWALKQFVDKYHAATSAHRDFYRVYVDARITGFMGHWMTLSAELMIALLVVIALVCFAKRDVWTPWLPAAAVPIAIALALAWTRSMWLGAACGVVYLLWFWNKWALAAAPVALAVILLVNPLGLRERVVSAVTPHAGKTDSNAHRAELRAIGWEMIRAHPWLGIGPEQVSRQYRDYIRPGMPAPDPSQYYGHLENDYLQYAAERGVPAMLALLGMIGWAVFDFARGLICLPSDAPERWVLHAAIAVTIAILVSGFYSWNLNNSETLGMFLAILGAGYVVLRPAKMRA